MTTIFGITASLTTPFPVVFKVSERTILNVSPALAASSSVNLMTEYISPPLAPIGSIAASGTFNSIST
ncbi:hypothetical protein, partial [Streptococcus suis]|uniref:hypothetical protein n=1 Tax=Streptococcus suis TaxID=1307 RepID=UPI001E2D4BE5